jgi:hypothetical protein
MIRTIRPLDRPDPGLEQVAKANGFSLHAGVSCERHERNKRERPGGVPLCRYIARPAVAVPRLSLSSTGKVVYTLKTPYRDGTTQVAFDPVDFIARLAALVPKPRVNLTRYHGVLACAARPQPPMARVGHSSWAWQGTEEGCKCRAKDTSRESCRYDLGAKAQARLQY